jgi:hypothetical protein
MSPKIVTSLFQELIRTHDRMLYCGRFNISEVKKGPSKQIMSLASNESPLARLINAILQCSTA